MARIKRLEFGAAATAAIMRRAGYPDDPRCEWPGCGASLKKGAHLDHWNPEWAKGGKVEGRTELTADDGWMLCLKCHGDKTRREAKERAKGNRIIAKAAGGLRKPKAKIKSRGFQTNRDSAWKKPFSGNAVRR